MEIKKRIIEYLEKNRLSTEEIGDILGKTGVVKNVFPISDNQYSVGEVQYVYAYNNSNWPVHEQLRNLQPDKILFVDSIFVEDDYAIFGELVSAFIIESKKARSIVVNGYMRDLEGLRKRHYKIWCKGITPIGCFNVKASENPEIVRKSDIGKAYYDGSIAVCDTSGVVIIPKEELTEEFISKMENMVEQERIWFDCVENKGWDTYDTVCLKKYKENNG